MAKKKEDESRRNRWLGMAKETVMSVFERNQRLVALCPEYRSWTDEKERSKQLKAVAKAGERLDQLCAQMAELEEQGEPMGVVAVLGSNPSNPIRIAVTLLIVRCLNEALASRIGSIGDTVEFASGRDPVASLEVRQAFRSDAGVIRPLVEVTGGGPNLDQFRVALKESSFNQAVGLKKDTEFEVLSAWQPWASRRRWW